jgi:hypothetical protein
MGAGVSGRLFPVALALARCWVRLYTSHMPPLPAEMRRAEIESDLWEMAHDPDGRPARASGLPAMLRLLRGIPDDLAWRFENAALEEQLILRRLLALTAVTAIMVSLLTASSLFLKGRRDVGVCAAEAPAPDSTAAFRLEVIRCAGAFFAGPGR